MRTILVFSLLISVISLRAQTFLPGSFTDYTQRQNFAHNNVFKDSTSQKKWSFNTYSGLSTSFIFSRAGNSTVISAPVGLQLNRRLNNNLYAFAAVTAAPAYINFNRSFLSADANKTWQNNSLLKSNSFGMYSRAELGLMYVNDARTFSISGSIGIESSNYPVFPYNSGNTSRPNPMVAPN